jgi:methionine-rich copper-binding protein CopC
VRATHGVLRLVLSALVAAGALVLLATPAQAHDELLSTSPADKAQVSALPDQVVLTFAEPPVKTGSQVLIKGPNGNAATGQPAVKGSQVSQAIAPGSPAGTYTVTWRVTSDDGHVVFGTFAFTAASGNAAAGPTPSPTASPTTTSASTAKSGASKALWLLVLVLLLVPVGLFLRRGRTQLREMSER